MSIEAINASLKNGQSLQSIVVSTKPTAYWKQYQSAKEQDNSPFPTAKRDTADK